MTRSRLFFFISTLVVVGILGATISFYARGYRFDANKLKFVPNGLYVVKSVPDGAQVLINGELVTATNANLSLSPGTYDVSIRKDGYLEWNKRLVIEKEVVTETTIHLFRSSPSLSSITFSGATNPIPSYDMSKIAYIVPENAGNSNNNKEGLWLIETVNLPIGFARDPRRVTDGNLKNSTWIWSPDGREILLATQTGTFLLDAGEFTPQGQLVNVASTRNKILEEWEEERGKRLNAQLKKLPDELEEILKERTSSIIFSPDEDMVLYSASSSASIPSDLIKQLPGSSTQKENRDIIVGHTYLYDIKEDRNFLIDSDPISLVLGGESADNPKRRLSWFATSRHLVLAEKEKVTIMDYDGTNRAEVYMGSYVRPHAFPALSIDRLLILTNLGADSALPNLYSLNLK